MRRRPATSGSPRKDPSVSPSAVSYGPGFAKGPSGAIQSSLAGSNPPNGDLAHPANGDLAVSSPAWGSSVSSSTTSPLQGAPTLAEPAAVNLLTDLIGRESSGRRGRGSIASRRASRATPYDQTGTLAINETLTVAAAGGRRVGERGIALSASDLMQHGRSGPGRSSVLFLVDASASMATQRRLELAKSAALGLLKSNYQHRDEVALMVFRGEGANLVMPFTSGIESVEQALNDVPTGGRTPLARALIDATELLRTREPSLLVVFTDGRANVSVGNEDPWAESLAACAELKEACAGAVVIDCEPGPIVLGRARQLAAALGAECVALSALEAAELTIRIQRRLDTLE
jgi:magnesium chelatase subunit D